MWPFHRREDIPKALLQAVTAQQATLGVLDAKVKALEDSLAALEDKHERLRGKFYSSRTQPEASDPTNKAAILAAFRRGEIRP